MVAITLSFKLMIVALLVLERQYIHDSTAGRQQWLDEYDFIVVGAGAAGSVVAERLIENCNNKVLLLEAGGVQTVVTDIPGNARSLIDSEFDWKFRTVPQTWFTPYRVAEPRGRVLGGSTTINNMIYNRGNKKDFDYWVTGFGANGWNYRKLLPYFIKSENNTDINVCHDNPGFHGKYGPVTISTDHHPNPILRIHQEALFDLGVPATDINGPNQLGTMIAQSFICRGLRSSTASSYLEPNRKPHHLHILTNAFVTKIIIDLVEDKLTATGVQFVKNGHTYQVRAAKEVILCAGTFNSPQILMLSGIGPRDHLTQLGIRTLVDLPVGNNLQDHPTISIHMLINNNNLVRKGPKMDIEQMYEVLAKGTGPLSVLTPTITFYTTSNITDKEWPNTYTYSIVEKISDLNNTVREIQANREEWKEYFRPYLNRSVLLNSPHLTRIRSYGTLRLSSADPFAHPIIDPQFLAHPQDYADLFETTKFMLYFLTETKLSDYISVFPDPIPGCSYCSGRKPYECDSYIQCLIRETIKSGYHPVGTCRMGSIYRKDVVVDERLRVKHVFRLRVIDASIMPQIINANTNAASIAIGEKGADLVRQDNGFFNYQYKEY